MSFTTAFNSFMAKKKRRGSTADELALVKAAAWAWYKHGSGSEGKPIGDFEIRRTQQPPKPSRYKLEAARSTEEDHAIQGSQTTDSPMHSDHNSLLETCEIESVSKRLEELIVEESGNKILVRKHDDDRKNYSTNSDDKKKCKKTRWFWPLRHAILCGTRQDVVVSRRALAADHHQQPEKREATVVELATCRLWVSHA